LIHNAWQCCENHCNQEADPETLPSIDAGRTEKETPAIPETHTEAPTAPIEGLSVNFRSFDKPYDKPVDREARKYDRGPDRGPDSRDRDPRMDRGDRGGDRDRRRSPPREFRRPAPRRSRSPPPFRRRSPPPRDRDRGERGGGRAHGTVQYSPPPADIVPLHLRTRKLNNWDVKPAGYDSITAEQAKATGISILIKAHSFFLVIYSKELLAHSTLTPRSLDTTTALRRS
jgi:hypothetical protein